jgi:nucleoside-diphosphate-sugar epimerase
MTGATGYLGSRIARSLVRSGACRLLAIKRRSSSLRRLEGLEKDIRFFDIEDLSWDRVFGEEPVDTVLHCATNYGRNHEARSNIVTSNLLLPLRLLEEGASRGLKAFINTDTMLDKGVSDYGLAKSQFRDWLKVFSSELLCVDFVLEHFFGPGDDPTKFVTYLLRELRRGAGSIALTKGEQTRDFIYVDDVVSAFEHVLAYAWTRDAVKGYEEFPVGTGSEISVAEFAQLACSLAGGATRLDLGALPYRPHETMHVHVDTSRMRALGWSPRFGLREALALTLDRITEE